jgi:uncharacterized protein
VTDQPIDNIVPLQREQPQWMSDSFVNFLAGLGVAGRDKFASQNYVHTPLTVMELEAAYRSDWVAKKIVTIPAWDMTREWRHWEADPDQIELLEEAEKKLFVQQKLQQAMIKARLYGGAVIIIGVDAGAPEDELDPEMVTQDSLKFLHVVSRHNIRAGPIIKDISSKYFGEPEYYEARQEPASQSFQQTIETVTPQYTQRQVKLHPSRVVRLIGLDTADQMLMDVWGDSVLQPVNDAVKMCGLVTGSLATLVAELKVDVIKIPELKSIMSTAAGERKMIARFMAANSAKSVINTIMIDGNEEWERIQANLTGVPETMMAYMQIAAGAADIPATRFLGMSPAGLNATGESDIRNYYDRLAAEQTTILTPTLNVLDEVLIRSALGDRPPEVWYDWNSLWQLNATEKAAIALQKAQAYQIDVNAAQLPPVALANARANQLMEDGVYPGLEKALEDAALEGDTIESQNGEAELPPEMEMMQAMPPPGQPGGPPPGPGQIPGAPPPMPPAGGNVVTLKPKKSFDAAPDDDEDIDDFNQCHNQSGEEGGEFCGEGSGGESGAGKVGGKGGGSPKPAKSDVHREAKSALERGKKAIGEGLKKLFGKGEPVKGNKGTPAAKKSEGTPAKAAKKDPAKPAKAAKTAKAPKAAKPDRGKAKSERKAAAAQKKLASAAKKSERETAKGAKKAERAAAKGQKAEARAAKKTAGQEKRAAKKEAAGAKKAERQSKAAAKKEASAAKKSERQKAAAAKKEANAAKAAAKKEAAAAKKAAAQKAKEQKRPKSKEKPEKEKPDKSKFTATPKKEAGGGGGGEKGKAKGGGGKEGAGGGGKGSAPKQQPKQQKEAPAKKEAAPPKETTKPQPKPEQKPGMTPKEYREALEKWREEERERLRRSLGLDSLVIHYGDADNPQLCDQCGGYHLCSACGGALFDHNQCHGPDGKFCSDPSGGPTRSEQRKEKAFERAAKSAFGGGEGKSWDFPREEKPKGKYESLGEAGERAKRNSERERKALRNEAERRLENLVKQMQKEATVKPEDIAKALAQAAVGLGKAGKWAYGKLRKSKAAAPKPPPPPVKRGRGRPRTRMIGPKRPRGRPRKH